jgi:ArsR family transcriptional regulator, arsenate/arsenite/antimonite-responsive transcriptional repressor
VNGWPRADIFAVPRFDSEVFRIYKLVVANPELELTHTLQAIADPTRRRILQALKEKGGCSLDKEVGLCASDIEARVKLSQPTISHHMAILTRVGLVEAKKIGLWRWYRRNESALRALTRNLKERL